MADDKKNIPKTVPPAEAPALTVENAVVPGQSVSAPALTEHKVKLLCVREQMINSSSFSPFFT